MGISAQSLSIEELIPQRIPMILVDTFEGIDEDENSHTRLTIRPDNLFVENGHMTECGIIEHMAQSAAARVGWACHSEGKPVPIGYIGAVSHFTAHQLPAVGSCLKTTMRIVQAIGPVSLAELRVNVENKLVAEGRLKIFLQI